MFRGNRLTRLIAAALAACVTLSTGSPLSALAQTRAAASAAAPSVPQGSAGPATLDTGALSELSPSLLGAVTPRPQAAIPAIVPVAQPTRSAPGGPAPAARAIGMQRPAGPARAAALAAARNERTSPLQGLLEQAPFAGDAVARKDVSGAREGSRDGFYRAARLEVTAPRVGAAASSEVPGGPDPGLGGPDPGLGGPEAAPQPRETPAGLQPAPIKASPTEQKVLDKVAQDLGPIIAPAQAPALHAALETLFSRLSASQQKLFPADAVSINRIRVVDTPVVNAFVYPIKTPGVRRSSNLVFITTGLLKKMIDAEPSKLREGLVRVAGVLAHELAHPLDNIDAEGILTNYGKEIGGQAREVRADAEGSMIAREAGYPVESVYESLKRLFADDADSSGLLESLTSTHPHNDLRLAMQRMLLTLDRYEKGSRAPSYPEEVAPLVLTELAALDGGAAAGRFVAPKDLAEALRRLEELSESKRGEAYKQLEFNRLVLAVDAMLSKRGPGLGDGEFRLFTEINRLLAKPGQPEILDRKGMLRVFTKTAHSEEFLAYPSHETFMKKVPAYGSPRYLDWVQANFYLRNDGYGTLERSLRALTRIMPCQLLFARYGDRIAADMPADMRAHPNSRYIYESSIAKNKSAEFRIRLAVLFHKKILPQLSEEERIAFVVESTHDQYSHVFPQARGADAKDYSLGILRQRTLLLGDPRLKDLQGEYRELLQTIWDDRGAYGTLDLIVAFNDTDWDSIFAVLGIDPQVGRGQLRQAVKQFAKTPAFAGIVKAVKESNLDAFRMLKLGHPMGKLVDFTWPDDTLGPYLSGDFNETLKAQPELLRLAKQLFAGAYYEARPEVFVRAYGRALAAGLAKAAGGPVSISALGALHGDIMASLAGGSRVSGNLSAVQAEAIDRAPLSASDKQALLRAVFLEGYPEGQRVSGLTYDRAGVWLSRGEGGKKAVLGVLVKNGLARDSLDLFSGLLGRDDFRKSAKVDGFSSYASAVSAFKEELLADLDAALAAAATDEEKAARLARFLETVVDPGDGDYAAAEMVNTPELRDVKARAASAARALEIPFAERLRLFRRLTGSGATPATDAFFQERLQATFDEPAAGAAGRPLSAILEQGRIAGAGLQLALTRRLLEPEIERLRSQPPDAEGLNRLIETLNAYVRQGSLKKDEYLERLGWRLGLSGTQLGAFIEDEKSYNWRKANPMLLRFGSALSAEISKLSAQARADFIDFLIEPEGRQLPDAILKELQRNLYAAALAVEAAKGDHTSKASLKEQSNRAAYLMKLEIEAALIDASPFERIPLFELLLSAGSNALRRAEGFPRNAARRFLGYEPGSTEEKMLEAYLAVVPPHEQTVSLAYLLSQAGQNKSSVKNIFEVFQTVGVKFGQLSSTWKLFGEEVARETASLKSNARPMTKAEILETMRRELSAQELARIKDLKAVIGSASLKTVVLVELTGGREVVMLLRRPRAAEQIETNLRLGQDFLRELERRGMTKASAMFDTVLEAVRLQLAEELKFTQEARSLRAAKAHFEGLNSSMRGRLGGWRFEVPGLVDGFGVRDSILFMEKASGTTFDKLSAADRAAAGPLIAESALSLLFRRGWFDADRHTGNQLIDPERRVIYPLDFGQAAPYSRKAFWASDERYELAQFLRAFSEGNASGVLRHGRAMAVAAGAADLSALREEIRKVLAGAGSMPDRLIGLVSAFAERGLRLDGKFTFGAFKGLMTLYGERYVPEEGFRALLAREIEALLRRKLPRTILDRR